MLQTKERVIVVGGGRAGCAAALDAARLGLKVTLVDEHPQPLAAMSLDAPYFYGARLAPALSDASATAERVLGANEALMECLEAGVDVLTGTCAWGVYVPGENNVQQREMQLGLAHETRSWMVAFDFLVLAPGARDLVISFPGWQLAGVLGACAAASLLTSYQALGGRRMLILGSGNLALGLAMRALESGVEVAGLVEPTGDLQGDELLAGKLRDVGALGDQEVTGAQVTAVSQPDGEGQLVACDTICMAFGAVPNIELGAVAGCKMEYVASLGGWVPELGPDMQTSLPCIFVVGDGAGLTESMISAPDEAMEQGRAAARAIARLATAQTAPAETLDPAARLVASRAKFPPEGWLAALIEAGGLDVQLCQCEEVTRREFLEVRPPRYLGNKGWVPKEPNAVGAPQGALSQDFLKRMTRVGMGHCQGKRCREHSALLLAHAKGVELSSVLPGSFRPPVRPLPVSVLFAHDEPPETFGQWPAWSWLHQIDQGKSES
jgi:D-hydroxyproline dehydrogenase subunit alpha